MRPNALPRRMRMDIPFFVHQ